MLLFVYDEAVTKYDISRPSAGGAEKPPMDDFAAMFDEAKKDTDDSVIIPAFLPEDNLLEVKEKLFIVTGIEPFKQHVAFGSAGSVSEVGSVGNLRTYYSVSCNNADVEVNFLRDLWGQQHGSDLLLGLPVDKAMLADDIQIETHEQFTRLADIESAAIHMTGIDYFLAPLTTQLSALATDTFKFKRFYYGFVAKFFPMFSEECFYDYITETAQGFAGKYPDLAMDRAQLLTRYSLEEQIYTASLNKPSAALAKTIMSTITGVVVERLAGKSAMLLNIRNIFDLFQVSEEIPEIRAKVRRGHDNYLLVKRYVRAEPKIPFRNMREMNSGIVFAIGSAPLYSFLTLWGNGNYYLRVSFEEHADDTTWADVEAAVKAIANPIIAAINRLGARVSGSKLGLIKKPVYRRLSLSMLWKRVITTRDFQHLKKVLNGWITAGVVSVKDRSVISASTSEYSIAFHKGITEYNRDIGRIVLMSTGIDLWNQYLYLTNAAVKSKWEQIFNGRLIHITHRATDVKFEIINIDHGEYEIVERYLTALIAEVSAVIGAGDDKPTSSINNLRKLREYDPVLFDLRRAGADVVYSRLCQSKHQPLVYTEDELRNMSEKDKKKLQKYWNFTLEQPAYYSCPHAEYHSFGFVTGAHPNGYCLPCCNKQIDMADVVGSKKARVFNTCMQPPHIFEAEETATRYIMSYGKDVGVGRLSKIPPTLEDLLFNTLQHNNVDYCLFGVEQRGGLGALFSFEAAYGTDDLTNRLARMGPAFRTLYGGRINDYFAGPAELTAALAGDTFTRFKDWTELTMELIARLYKVNVFLVSEVTLTLMNEFIEGAPSIVLLQKESMAIYPMFVHSADGIHTKLFPADSVTVRVLRDAVASSAATAANGSVTPARVVEAMKSAPTKQFVNRRNLCYALLYDAVAYLAVDESPPLPATPTSYEMVAVEELPTTASTMSVLKDLKLYDLTNVEHGDQYFIVDGTYIFYTSDRDRDKDKFNMYEINKVIERSEPRTMDEALAEYSDNYLYQLFVMEFLHLKPDLSKVRNAQDIQKIMKPIVKFGRRSNVDNNILTPKGELYVPSRTEFNSMSEILAADIKNDLKFNYVRRANAETAIDYFRFEPSEDISVYKLTAS